MGRNIFVTHNKVHPIRWKLAFPQAAIVPNIPKELESGTLLWLHEILPETRLPNGIRFVEMHNEPNDDNGMEALARGASGYCNTHSTPELLQTIEMVVRGNGLWVGESLLNRLVSGISTRSQMAGKHDSHPQLDCLSERERAIALCVARGESNKEITQDLNISERTIKAHLTLIFKKLGVRDRLQLAILLNTPK